MRVASQEGVCGEREAGGGVTGWPGVSEPLQNPRLRVLSLGVGVQSSTLLLMSERGDLEPLDYAIFSDTGDEPRKVYEHLEWLEATCKTPIIRTRRPGKTLSESSIDVAQGRQPVAGSPLPPWYLVDESGKLSMSQKQCSFEFKKYQVERVVREKMGLAPRQRGPKGVHVEMWIGISTDEKERMSTGRIPWMYHRHPLIEHRMTRRDCIKWTAERQLRVAPKSSCKYCPFRRNDQWRAMRDNEPDDFADACEVDRLIRPG